MSQSRLCIVSKRLAVMLALTSLMSTAIAQNVVIGATVPLTGPLSLTGKQYFNSLKLAEEDINKAGGLQGKPAKFVFEDTQTSNGTAVTAYVKLVQESKPAFTFLTSYSTQTIAVAPEVGKAAIPAMYAGSAEAVAKLGNPWLFRLRPEDSIAAVAMARIVKNTLKLSKPGIIYIQNDYGQGGANAVTAALKEQGIAPVGIESYRQDDKDMSAQLVALKNKGVETIIAFVYPQDGAMLLRQIKMLGFAQPVIASSGVLVPAALQLLSPRDLENVWGVLDTYLPASEKGRNYVARYKQKFSMEADAYGAAYYDGAMLMGNAINAVGTEPQKLQAYLRGVRNYQGVAHTYSFDNYGNGVHDVSVIKFLPGTKDMQFIETIEIK